MPENDDSEQAHADVTQAGMPSVASIGTIRQVESPPHDPPPANKAENATDKAAQRTATATVWIAAFTVVMGLVGIGTLIVIIEGGSDTKDLVTATQNLAEAASGQATSMQLFADRMKDQADRTKTIAEQAVVQANAATTASNTAASSLKQSRNTFLAEQRPYVWVDRFEVQNVTIGQPLSVNVYLVNYGTTPAKAVAFLAHIGSGQAVEQLCDSFHRDAQTGSSIVGAGKSDLWKTAISVEDVNAGVSKPTNWDGKMPIAVFGKIFYTDFLSSGIVYRSDYCVELLEGKTPLFVVGKNSME